MKDFLTFRHMLMPLLIQILFWVGMVLSIVTGVIDLFRGQIANGVSLIILGPIMVRLACELTILFFRINETLTDIKNILGEHHEHNP
jgi:hypothetical protein